MKPFKFRRVAHPTRIPLEPFPALDRAVDDEALTGSVQGKQASAPEERLAKALDKANIQYYFRYAVGAPRNMPGWKELDFLISHAGMVYALEVDTAFTHRKKAYSDVLHDAIIQNDRTINGYGTLWPQVFHASGDSELANDANAKSYVQQKFGKG